MNKSYFVSLYLHRWTLCWFHRRQKVPSDQVDVTVLWCSQYVLQPSARHSRAFAINYISQSVRSSFHSARRRKRGLGSVPISLLLYPSLFDKLPMQCQNLGQAKAMAFLIQNFTAMKGNQKIIGRARQSL